MAKDRNVACIHYVYEGCCDLGRSGNFYGHCQKCSSYKKNKKAKEARVDTRRKKESKICMRDYE